MTIKKYAFQILVVGTLVTTLSACATFSRINPLSQKPNVTAAISSTSVVPFNGDFQSAYELVLSNAKSCFSKPNQVVKTLQLNDGMPAQIDIFDRGSSPAEPLPADLRVKAFLEPAAGGGRVKIDTFSSTGEYGHARSVNLIRGWLANQKNC